MKRSFNFQLWIIAGIVSGMAILTRSVGVVLFGITGLTLLIRTFYEIRQGRFWFSTVRKALMDGTVWLMSTVGTVFLLLPALWVEPSNTLEKLWAWSSNAATEGHENPTFFNGIHYGDPGLIVYPVVLAWRTSPSEWIGLVLIISLIWWAACRSRIDMPTLAFLGVCIVFVIIYVVAMSFGAKKFDRYILPVFPVLTVLAAQGIHLFTEWLKSFRGRWVTRIAYSAMALILMVQVFSWNSTRPYRLDYYNPILGGPTSAQHVLQMGWGQGGDQVIDYLLTRTTDGPITVQTSAVPSAFTYFLADDSPIHFRTFGLGTPAGWFETDYYVVGIQQTQRHIAPWFDLFGEFEPVHTVIIGGVNYFDIYEVRNLPLPEPLRILTACNYVFGEEVTLMQIIERDSTVDFYFLSDSMYPKTRLTFTIDVTNPDGGKRQHSVDLWPAPSGRMNRITIPNSLPGLTNSRIAIRATMNGADIPVSNAWSADVTSQAITHSECYYAEPPVEISQIDTTREKTDTP